MHRLFALLTAVVLSVGASACGGGSAADAPPPLVIGGVPDQDVALLEERFGGLTGVQARRETPGARAVAQRPIDTEFRSVFIAGAGVPVVTLQDLAGTRFTFGSESSTSGHLMPRFFLQEAGVDPEADFDGRVGYSGSHDTTWKLVEAGSFQAGA